MGVTGRSERRFELRLQPTPALDGWGFTLTETGNGQTRQVLSVPAGRASPFRACVSDAVAASGYQRSAVSPRRKRPFNLPQDPGVLLALTVGAALPLRKPVRRHAVERWIAAFSSEEALYWYAQTDGASEGRALRALRILSAEG